MKAKRYITTNEEYNKLSEEEKRALKNWIKKNFIPTERTYLDGWTSYGLKHVFEESFGGFYVTNDQFKWAMLECGFKPKDPSALNWKFKISKRSPGLVEWYRNNGWL